MSLSACEKCWDTPCCCGWDFRHYEKNPTAFSKYIKDITLYLPREMRIKVLEDALKELKG